MKQNAQLPHNKASVSDKNTKSQCAIRKNLLIHKNALPEAALLSNQGNYEVLRQSPELFRE